MGATAPPTAHAPEPRGSRWMLVLLAFLAGGLGSAVLNWRIIGSMSGLLPPTTTGSTQQVLRETTVEDSSFTATASQAAAALPSLIARADADAARRGDAVETIGSALVLSDDGLLLLLEPPTAPKDVAISTRDGYVASVTRIGTDPWSGAALARADLRAVPANELHPLPLRTEPPTVGQRVVVLDASGGFAVSAAVVARRPAPGVRLHAPIRSPLALSPELTGAAVAVDLGGALVAVGFGERGGLSAPALASLVSTYQRTGRIARPVFGLASSEVLPGMSTTAARPLFGALVTEVEPGGPYAQAGGRTGDLITAINGRELSESERLADALARQLPGAMVDVVALRDGVEVALTLTAGESQ